MREIAFKNIIFLFLNDGLRNTLLTAHGIDSNGAILNSKQFEQGGNY